MDKTKECFLVSTDSLAQSSLFQQILRSNDIPFYVEKSGSSGAVSIYMGYSTAFGENIIVNKEDYNKAYELIYNSSPINKSEDAQKGFDNYPPQIKEDDKSLQPALRSYKRRKAVFKVLLRTVIIASVILLICFSVLFMGN